jgi:superfamily II DNA helicase RecQ
MDSDVCKELKAYRLRKCREENTKPYFIFNDKQMEDLISKNPKAIDDLMKVSGFGEAKCKNMVRI